MKDKLIRIKKNGIEQISIEQWLLISTAFSIMMLTVRILNTGFLTYAFLVWNLFLGYIPLFITNWMRKNILLFESRIKLSAVLLVWLLFMPNSFYIITDLFHLSDMDTPVLWFDLMMIFSFAWNGLVAGLLSVYRMEQMLKLTKGKWISFFIISAVMWLCAFGVYIGRYLRFNSWDVLTNPFSLAKEILSIVFNPADHVYAWGMTICFSSFMIILYYTIKKMGESRSYINH